MRCLWLCLGICRCRVVSLLLTLDCITDPYLAFKAESGEMTTQESWQSPVFIDRLAPDPYLSRVHFFAIWCPSTVMFLMDQDVGSHNIATELLLCCKNSSSQAHTFSFLFHTELYYYYGAVSCHTAHSKVLDTEVVKHGTRRRKEKLDSALILDFGWLWPTIGLLLQTWKRLQKRSHECKETVAVPQ